MKMLPLHCCYSGSAVTLRPKWEAVEQDELQGIKCVPMHLLQQMHTYTRIHTYIHTYVHAAALCSHAVKVNLDVGRSCGRDEKVLLR